MAQAVKSMQNQFDESEVRRDREGQFTHKPKRPKRKKPVGRRRPAGVVEVSQSPAFRRWAGTDNIVLNAAPDEDVEKKGEEIGYLRRVIEKKQEWLSVSPTEESHVSQIDRMYARWREIVADSDNPTEDEINQVLDEGLLIFSTPHHYESYKRTASSEWRNNVTQLEEAKVKLAELESSYRPDRFQTGSPFAAVVYHGSPTAGFRSFDSDMLGENTNAGSAKQGFFFSGTPDTASGYAGGDDEIIPHVGYVHMPPHLRGELRESIAQWIAGDEMDGFDVTDEQLTEFATQHPEAVRDMANDLYDYHGMEDKEYSTNTPTPGVYKVFIKMKNPYVYDQQKAHYREKAYAEIIHEASKKGHDGVVILRTYDSGAYHEGYFGTLDNIFVVFEPNQAKSAISPGDFLDDSDISKEFRDIWRKKDEIDGDGDGRIFDGTNRERAAPTSSQTAAQDPRESEIARLESEADDLIDEASQRGRVEANQEAEEKLRQTQDLKAQIQSERLPPPKPKTKQEIANEEIDKAIRENIGMLQDMGLASDQSYDLVVSLFPFDPIYSPEAISAAIGRHLDVAKLLNPLGDPEASKAAISEERADDLFVGYRNLREAGRIEEANAVYEEFERVSSEFAKGKHPHRLTPEDIVSPWEQSDSPYYQAFRDKDEEGIYEARHGQAGVEAEIQSLSEFYQTDLDGDIRKYNEYLSQAFDVPKSEYEGQPTVDIVRNVEDISNSASREMRAEHKKRLVADISRRLEESGMTFEEANGVEAIMQLDYNDSMKEQSKGSIYGRMGEIMERMWGQVWSEDTPDSDRHSLRANIARAVAAVIDSWASSSMDHSLPAWVIQMSAGEEFADIVGENNLLAFRNDHREAKEASTLHGNAKIAMNIVGGSVRKILRAMYENTQETLAKAGVEQVPVYRGLTLAAEDMGEGVSMFNAAGYKSRSHAMREDRLGIQYVRKGRVNMNPISSFSTDYRTSLSFSTMGDGFQSIITALVPRERILSTFTTGFGCMPEHELTILGGDGMEATIGTVDNKAVAVSADRSKSWKFEMPHDPVIFFDHIKELETKVPRSGVTAES